MSYADEVLARAIGWSQHSFCINCGVEAAMVEAVHAAYGAPVLEPAHHGHGRLALSPWGVVRAGYSTDVRLNRT